MSASTAHGKIVTLLGTKSTPPWDAVYNTHQKANLVVPSLSVEVETEVSLPEDQSLVSQQLVDNRQTEISIRVHTAYKLGNHDTVQTALDADVVIRFLRENIDLADAYWIMDVIGTAYNVELPSSGTIGAEIKLIINKVEYYDQS